MTETYEDPDDAVGGSEELRVEAIISTLQDRLVLVAIDLTGHDDAQLIFETLNDRGTPLLKADLIKNWVFREGERLGADVNRWAETYWSDFDTSWWREEVKQGRLMRSRVDIFLQYWLTMRRQDEVKTDQAFRIFVEHAKPYMTDSESADRFLVELRQDADTYKGFAQLGTDSPEGSFYERVIERLEMAVTTPVFLWLLSKNHQVPKDQRSVGLSALESWAIRRTLLKMTTKDINRFAVSILKVLSDSEPARAGIALARYLREQTAETRLWPSDMTILVDVPKQRLYGSLRQDRLRVVLGALEQHLRERSERYETLTLPERLEIEHVMPRRWRLHWDCNPRLDPEAAAERDAIIHTLGNLTLVTKSLNASLSNRPWSDSAASDMKDGGEAGKGKRTLLDAFSLLVLNKEITKFESAWTEADIRDRSSRLSRAICEVWPGPDAVPR